MNQPQPAPALTPSFQALLNHLDHLPDEFQADVQRALRVAESAPEVAVILSRKVLERVVREVYQRRCHEPPGTRPLEGLIQRLVKDGFFPDRLDAYATTVRKLGNVGAHSLDEQVTSGDVHQSLSQLQEILHWYVHIEQPDTVLGKAPKNAVNTSTSLPAAGNDTNDVTEKGALLEPIPPGKTTVKTVRPAMKTMDAQVAAQFRSIGIVPKGLRSFDAKDADFFLDLLPGPRDKDGLPESIRFWKHRIEELHDLTFTVGMIYGPSGCGKSSMVKAGLLPQLANTVLSVYVEATAGDTEVRLLNGLRKKCPNLPSDLDLARTIAALRHGSDQKVFIVLDQFEQWLHAKRAEENTELARALRQCDGEHVQCVVMVRDDFFLAVNRFLKELNVQLVEGQNLALIDQFDLIHARNVLSAFGRAFGRLPEAPSSEQTAFVNQAVEGLGQDGRVISVRLALFAEMVKGKAWTPSTLKEVGGMEGVGVTFLEETFTSPKNRLHQKAARAVLKALLPEQGTDIKGNMQSHERLLDVSEYARRPREFGELLRILDQEVRLITPTDPEGTDSERTAPAGEQYYQLTHDYLVPSLREWLTRKQKETRRGRAELRLADRAALWHAKPENHHLPAWWEWAGIRLLTQRKDWNAAQRKMMRKASRYHAVRGLVLVTCLALLTWGVWEGFGHLQGRALVARLLNANTADVPTIVADIAPYRRWANPLLRNAAAEPTSDARKQLHVSLALLPVDFGQVEYLYERLLNAEPHEAAIIRDAMYPHREELAERLWGVVQKPATGKEGQRLRAACALATYDPKNQLWQEWSCPVVEQLVSVSAVHLHFWMDGLRPLRDKLQQPLIAVFHDHSDNRVAERTLAANILAEYAAGQPDVLADLLQDADEKQFTILWPKVEANREAALAVFHSSLQVESASKTKDEDKEQLANRQANAAVALLRLGQAEKVWRVFQFRSDPRVRSYVIHRLRPLGADPTAIIKRLEEEPDISIRRALLLALGELKLRASERVDLVPRVLQLYRDDPDPGLHGAAEWLLRQWQQADKLKEMERASAKRSDERLKPVQQEWAKSGKNQWYVNSQEQTMVVIAGPVEFLMGSPPSEAGRAGGPEGKVELQHRKKIGRSFAIAAKEVTVAQFQRFYQDRFHKDFKYHSGHARTSDSPINNVSWYEAAEYCNWLSEQERLPKEQWCYEVNTNGEYAEGMKLAPNFLERTGYRLPTEAEWEYGCRAGSQTSRYYGETEELLGKYAQYSRSSQEKLWPVGSLKPNDLGLFDMLGNAFEWCQDRIQLDQPLDAASTSLDVADTLLQIKDDQSRLLHGGAFYDQAGKVRSAVRVWIRPTYIDYGVGFRPARTWASE